VRFSNWYRRELPTRGSPRFASFETTHPASIHPIENQTTMTTRTHASTASAARSAHASHAAPPEEPAAPAQSTPTASPAKGGALIFLAPPPADAKIPPVTQGFVPTGGTDYRSVVPKLTELAALSGAVEDLGKFTNYAAALGSTAPPYAQVFQAFDVCNQWTSMRKATLAWDGFCQTQEGISWATVRIMMERLRPAFDLAVVGDSSLAVTYPSLASLLGAKKAIASKGAATRRLNKKAIAEGKPPTHGGVGKKRKRAAMVAAAAAASTGATTAAAAAAATPPAATVAAGGASLPPAAPVVAAVAPPSAVATAPAVNGGEHS